MDNTQGQPLLDTDVPLEIRRMILEAEVADVKAARYRLTMRHRVNQRIGASDAELKNIETALERLERGLCEWEAVLAELNAAAPPAA